MWEDEDGTTVLQAIRPDKLIALVDNDALAPLAREIQEKLERALRAAATASPTSLPDRARVVMGKQLFERRRVNPLRFPRAWRTAARGAATRCVAPRGPTRPAL